MASSSRSRENDVDQVEADRRLAEMLRRQWEEEDGVIGQHLGTVQDPDISILDFDISTLDEDYELARKIQEEGDVENTDINMNGSVIDSTLELTDPNPGIWHLFRCFDARFFNRKLVSSGVELSWSQKMTQCAGLCGWNPRSGACFIRLSKPLLELRPRKDLVETLIHEMIHALLFVERVDDNHESHGQVFHHEMYRINREGQCNITVYHNFHDEVRHFKTHVWRCTGPCRDKSPYHGWVKRSMNRPPQPADWWFNKHQATCGGTFVKVSEPPVKKMEGGGKGKRKKRDVPKSAAPVQASPSQNLHNYFSPVTTSPSSPIATHTLSTDREPQKSKGKTTIIVEIDLE